MKRTVSPGLKWVLSLPCIFFANTSTYSRAHYYMPMPMLMPSPCACILYACNAVHSGSLLYMFTPLFDNARSPVFLTLLRQARRLLQPPLNPSTIIPTSLITFQSYTTAMPKRSSPTMPTIPPSPKFVPLCNPSMTGRSP